MTSAYTDQTAVHPETNLLDARLDALDAMQDSNGKFTRSALAADVAAAVVSRGARVIALGDSITSGQSPTSPAQGYLDPTSWFTWAAWYAGDRLVYLRNAGGYGNTLQQMLDRIDADVIAKSPDIVLLNGGTNDLSTKTVTQMAVTYTAIVDRIAAAGARVFPVTIQPRTDANAPKVHAFNAWLRSYGVSRRLTVLDGTTPLLDRATGLADASLLLGDGLHPSQTGAHALGKAIGTQLTAILPLVSLPLALYKGDLANLITNGVFLGDANSDGIADGWSITGTTGTLAGQLVADAETGTNWQQLDWSAAGNKYLTQQVLTGWTTGDVIRFSGRVKASGIAGGNVRVQMSMPGANPDKLSPVYMATVPAFGPLTFSISTVAATGIAGLVTSIMCTGTGSVSVANLSIRNETRDGTVLIPSQL